MIKLLREKEYDGTISYTIRNTESTSINVTKDKLLLIQKEIGYILAAPDIIIQTTMFLHRNGGYSPFWSIYCVWHKEYGSPYFTLKELALLKEAIDLLLKWEE